MIFAADSPTPVVDAQPRIRPGTDLGRPVRAVVLSNPEGGFNRRRDHFERARGVVAARGFEHVEAGSPAEIYRAARQLDADGVELLVVNGGDGTVQMVLTALFSAERYSPPPLLALLAGGTSNTIHGDVGWGAAPIEALDAALAAAARGQLEGSLDQRSVLQVESPLWERPMCAMQFSAGAIYNAIKFAKHEVEGRGAYGGVGPFVTLAWFVLTILTGRSGKIFPPMRVRGSIDGRPLDDTTYLGLLISTLDRLFLGIRPFWDTGPGRIRYGAMAYRPRRLALALWPILRGRRGRFVTPENGYVSVNGERIELEIDAGFMLDGELFDVDSRIAITITAPARATFLRPRAGR